MAAVQTSCILVSLSVIRISKPDQVIINMIFFPTEHSNKNPNNNSNINIYQVFSKGLVLCKALHMHFLHESSQQAHK